MFLIGSRMIKCWFDDFPREPKDWDYIVKEIPKEKTPNTEYHLNPILADREVLTISELYTLKISHIFWDVNWAKHMFDIQFLRKKGCTLDKDLFTLLYQHWNEVHGKKKKSDLTLSSKDFFDNTLKTYDHDFLHTLINPVPIYTKILKEGSEVEPDENKFNLLSHEDKLKLVREEVYIMAYERLHGRDYRTAYAWMLKKFIMNHAPMWEALWIIENYIELHMPKINYKIKLDNELSGNNQ